jgi:cbb3-type cytochrome oxidase maturation protein
MSSQFESQTFLFMWIGFLLLMSCGIAAFFFWAIRAGQFGDQERARSLALQARIPDPEEPDPGGAGRKLP